MNDKTILVEVISEILARPENAELKANYTTLDQADFCKFWPQKGPIIALSLFEVDLRAGVPDTFASLSHLEELNLSQNNLSELPINVLLKLKNLRKLTVKHNNIGRFYELKALNQLEFLNLDYNSIFFIPKDLELLINLKRLSLSYNRITTIAPNIHFNKLSKLEALSLNYNSISDLPEGIGALENLKELGINYNQLKVLPKTVNQLKALSRIYLEGNQLESLPEDLSGLTQLNLLNLSHNKFKELPNSILYLQALKKLNISFNHIKSLPVYIGKSTKWENLDLSHNTLAQNISGLQSLTRLKSLDLSHNQLEKLELDFISFKDLKSLDISYNQLKNLPSSIDSIKSQLDEFTFQNNDLQIPDEIEAKKPETLITYIRDIEIQGSQPLNEGKIIVLGEGKAGKTTLINRIVKDEFIPGLNRTKGIVITPWGIPNQKITLSIWDFGGQEIMHAMHQFFMTKRTIYILTCDFQDADAEKKTRRWLELINAFAQNSPVIIAISQCDEYNDYELDHEMLKKNYPNVFEIIRTSALEGDGIDDLKNSIFELVNMECMKHIRDQIPLKQFKIKEKLVEKQRTAPSISSQDYYDICSEALVEDRQQQDNLLELLNDLGVIFRFSSNHFDKKNLQTPYVLKPEWVTKGIYSVVKNKTIGTNGLITLNDFKKFLLPREEYEGRELFIINLMIELKLCLPFDMSYLIPSLIKKKSPDFDNNFHQGLQFSYEYKLLPPAFLPQLIVSCGEKLHQYWRYGAVLLFNENKVQIRADKNSNELNISIVGNKDRAETLWELNAIIEDLNRRLSPDYQPILYYFKTDNAVKIPVFELISSAKEGEIVIYVSEKGSKSVKINIKQIAQVILTTEQFQQIYHDEVFPKHDLEKIKKHIILARQKDEILLAQLEEGKKAIQRYIDIIMAFSALVIVIAFAILALFIYLNRDKNEVENVINDYSLAAIGIVITLIVFILKKLNFNILFSLERTLGNYCAISYQKKHQKLILNNQKKISEKRKNRILSRQYDKALASNLKNNIDSYNQDLGLLEQAEDRAIKKYEFLIKTIDEIRSEPLNLI